MQKTIYFLIAIFLLLGQSSRSQTRNDSLKNEKYKTYIHNGDSCLAVKEYASAIAHYTAALMVKQNDTYATEQIEKLIREAKPMYHATLAGMSRGEVGVNQLLNDSLLRITEPGFEIISFRMSAYEEGVEPIEIDGEGNRLTDSMREAISRLHKGAKIYFEYIKAVLIVGNDAVFKIEPISFTIK